MFSHYCPFCRGSIYDDECTGESVLYKSWNLHELCERCFLIEDTFVAEMGTNDLPDWLAAYEKNDKELNV